jgi:ribosomal protein S12 methylthiotransferase accessory factor
MMPARRPAAPARPPPRRKNEHRALADIAPLSLDRVFDQRLPKRFRRGTHRLATPEETLARVRPHAARMGITRLGNITGLDRIGIPVAVAVRPNSRSVSVAQGKGLERPQAMASALMEACEGFHAEVIGPTRRATYRDLAAHETVADATTLCAGARPFDPIAAIDWTEGYDLLRREACWVPAEIVHTDYARPQPEGYFLAGSNGLASGNHRVEALNAALYELAERDALAVWMARPLRQRAGRLLDLASIDDPDCRVLLERYAAAAIAVRVWDITTDLAIAAFLCEIRDAAAGDPEAPRRFHGSGCHADRGIALARALTEAAQSRLTYIAGIRDDLSPEEYRAAPGDDIRDALLDALGREVEPRRFGAVPSAIADDLTDDLRGALDRLSAAGIARAVAVDLTRPEFDIPVVRLVIPGLEWDPHHPNYRPGPRARAVGAP